MNEPNLTEYDLIVVNSSAGKDSQSALHVVVTECDRLGIPRSRIVVSHQDLGVMEWEGTQDLARRQAEFYGLRFIVSKRRTKDGVEESLLDYVERRRRWPDNKNRFCTSDFKRGPGSRIITALANEIRTKDNPRPRILQVFGFRAEESPARKKKVPFEPDARLTNTRRQVDTWLPIHDWTTEQVWDVIRSSGVPWHRAYDLGMPRLSCVFCIFAPKGALMIAGKHNPDLLKTCVDLETRIGHRFTQKLSLGEVQESIDRGGKVEAGDSGCWNM